MPRDKSQISKLAEDFRGWAEAESGQEFSFPIVEEAIDKQIADLTHQLVFKRLGHLSLVDLLALKAELRGQGGKKR